MLSDIIVYSLFGNMGFQVADRLDLAGQFHGTPRRSCVNSPFGIGDVVKFVNLPLSWPREFLISADVKEVNEFNNVPYLFSLLRQ